MIFDSIVPQGGSLARQDEDANEAAKDFFGVCGKDAFCSQKLGTDPWAKVTALFAKLKTGHCSEIALPDLPNHVLFRRAFGGLLMDANLRPYIPAIAYRLDRCEAKDVPALKVLVAKLAEEQPESEMMKQWGWVLSYNIIFSELWETPSPSALDLETIRENAVASRGVTLGMQLLLGKWPTYKPDAYNTKWAETKIPLLFLQGGLDPATLLPCASRETAWRLRIRVGGSEAVACHHGVQIACGRFPRKRAERVGWCDHAAIRSDEPPVTARRLLPDRE